MSGAELRRQNAALSAILDVLRDPATDPSVRRTVAGVLAEAQRRAGPVPAQRQLHAAAGYAADIAQKAAA